MSPFRILKLIYNLRHALASRLSVGVAFLVLLGYLCLVWSWWLSILAVTGILISIAAKQFERIGFIWLGLSLICVLMLLGYTGILPSISRRGTTNSAMSSCFETKIHKTLALVFPSGAPPRVNPSALDQRRQESKQDAARYLFQARRTVGVDETLTAVSRILDIASAPGLEDAPSINRSAR